MSVSNPISKSIQVHSVETGSKAYVTSISVRPHIQPGYAQLHLKPDDGTPVSVILSKNQITDLIYWLEECSRIHHDALA